MVIVLMGAAGAGKSTVGEALSAALGWTFVDADALHPSANVEKIRSGTPLTDADRAPWLARTHDVIVDFGRRQIDAVLACSALRERYRALLGEGNPEIRWVFLQAGRDLLVTRLRTRSGHFAGPQIVDSQLRDLEAPGGVLPVLADLPVEQIVEKICTAFGLQRRRIDTR